MVTKTDRITADPKTLELLLKVGRKNVSYSEIEEENLINQAKYLISTKLVTKKGSLYSITKEGRVEVIRILHYVGERFERLEVLPEERFEQKKRKYEVD